MQGRQIQLLIRTFLLSGLCLLFSACNAEVIPETNANSETSHSPSEAVVVNTDSAADGKHTLWKVKGQSNTLYLLGSIHLMPPEFYPLPQPYYDAFEDAEKLVFEIDESIQDQAAAQEAMLKYAKLPGGKSLKDLISAEEYTEIRKLAKDNKVPMFMVDPFDPWFSSITLISLQYLNAGLSPEYGIDQHFMQRAQKAGKPILGLETLDQQFGMFDSISLDLQVDMLQETLRQETDMQEFVDQMLEEWQSGDMQGLEELLFEEFEESQEMYEALLVNRNLDWLEQFAPMLKDQDDYLVVVGAAHMLGDDGMVKLLEGQGYSVEQL